MALPFGRVSSKREASPPSAREHLNPIEPASYRTLTRSGWDQIILTRVVVLTPFYSGPFFLGPLAFLVFGIWRWSQNDPGSTVFIAAAGMVTLVFWTIVGYIWWRALRFARWRLKLHISSNKLTLDFSPPAEEPSQRLAVDHVRRVRISQRPSSPTEPGEAIYSLQAELVGGGKLDLVTGIANPDVAAEVTHEINRALGVAVAPLVLQRAGQVRRVILWELAVFAVLLGCIGILALVDARFTVAQDTTVIIIRDGQPIGDSIDQPGQYWKWPLLDSTHVLSNRVMHWDGDDILPTRDKVFIRVKYLLRWRIDKPLLFQRKLGNEFTAKMRLADRINGALRDVVVNYRLGELLQIEKQDAAGSTSLEETPIEHVLDLVRGYTNERGIELVDLKATVSRVSR